CSQMRTVRCTAQRIRVVTACGYGRDGRTTIGETEGPPGRLSSRFRRPILKGMKPEALLHPTPAGLFCPIGRFHVDPVRPVERALITHGHSDHARAGHGRVLAT